MPDRLKYIQVIFSDDGLSIKREYKSVHFEGEGAPRDVDITTEERLALYAVAHEASIATLSEANAAREQAEVALAAAVDTIAQRDAQIADLQAQLASVTAERDALQAAAEEEAPA